MSNSDFMYHCWSTYPGIVHSAAKRKCASRAYREKAYVYGYLLKDHTAENHVQIVSLWQINCTQQRPHLHCTADIFLCVDIFPSVHTTLLCRDENTKSKQAGAVVSIFPNGLWMYTQTQRKSALESFLELKTLSNKISAPVWTLHQTVVRELLCVLHHHVVLHHIRSHTCV